MAKVQTEAPVLPGLPSSEPLQIPRNQHNYSTVKHILTGQFLCSIAIGSSCMGTFLPCGYREQNGFAQKQPYIIFIDLRLQ